MFTQEQEMETAAFEKESSLQNLQNNWALRKQQYSDVTKKQTWKSEFQNKNNFAKSMKEYIRVQRSRQPDWEG